MFRQRTTTKDLFRQFEIFTLKDQLQMSRHLGYDRNRENSKREITPFVKFLLNRIRFPDGSRVPERVIFALRKTNEFEHTQHGITWKTFDAGFTWNMYRSEESQDWNQTEEISTPESPDETPDVIKSESE